MRRTKMDTPHIIEPYGWLCWRKAKKRRWSFRGILRWLMRR